MDHRLFTRLLQQIKYPMTVLKDNLLMLPDVHSIQTGSNKHHLIIGLTKEKTETIFLTEKRGAEGVRKQDYI